MNTTPPTMTGQQGNLPLVIDAVKDPFLLINPVTFSKYLELLDFPPHFSESVRLVAINFFKDLNESGGQMKYPEVIEEGIRFPLLVKEGCPGAFIDVKIDEVILWSKGHIQEKILLGQGQSPSTFLKYVGVRTAGFIKWIRKDKPRSTIEL